MKENKSVKIIKTDKGQWLVCERKDFEVTPSTEGWSEISTKYYSFKNYYPAIAWEFLTEEKAKRIVDETVMCKEPYRYRFDSAIESLKSILESHNITPTNDTIIFRYSV